MNITTRWLEADDVPVVVNYWATMPEAELVRMAIPRVNLPSAEALRESLLAELKKPDAEKRFCYRLWILDGRAVGYSSLKRIRFAEYGDMHLHVVDPTLRGKGLGPTFFCLSSIAFSERFRLNQIVCEPSANNPFPNRMLQKIGYRLVKSYRTISSELTGEDLVNQYDIDPQVSRAYLALNGS